VKNGPFRGRRLCHCHSLCSLRKVGGSFWTQCGAGGHNALSERPHGRPRPRVLPGDHPPQRGCLQCKRFCSVPCCSGFSLPSGSLRSSQSDRGGSIQRPIMAIGKARLSATKISATRVCSARRNTEKYLRSSSRTCGPVRRSPTASRGREFQRAVGQRPVTEQAVNDFSRN